MMNHIKDIDGNPLQEGDKVSTVYGECIIQRGETRADKYGDFLTVKDKAGHRLDLRVKLAQVRFVPNVIDANARTTTERFGV
jgi:hypothetical protein